VLFAIMKRLSFFSALVVEKSIIVVGNIRNKTGKSIKSHVTKCKRKL